MKKTLSPEDTGRNAPRYEGVVCVEDIAQELGVSRQRAAAILQRALAKLKIEFERRGIRSVDDLI